MNLPPKKSMRAAIICAITLSLLFYSCNKDTSFQPLAASSSAKNPFVTAGARPNIILILGDDIGYEIPTYTGGESYETPNIDRMSTEGMQFTQCYATPLCSPSRFELLTGKYNFRNYEMFGHMEPTEKTMANMLKDQGYATYVAGKWQLDGGDSSIHSLGFDDYCVWNAFLQDEKRRYKSPILYEHGNYIDASLVKNKYADDIFAQRILQFINGNRDKNFFVYFPLSLSHPPFQPTPDDLDYDAFDPRTGGSDPKYFPSMIKYMDKKIGQIIDSLKAWNLYNNTIVIFTGDNGTPNDITSLYKGSLIRGGKGTTTVYGTKVPLLVTWPGHIPRKSINNNLVDFSDFLPTIADASLITVPLDFGTTDGLSFYNQLIKGSYTPRSWAFCHYQPHNVGQPYLISRFAQTKAYKLYDSTDYFFNIINDPLEKRPLRNLTQTQSQIKENLRAAIQTETN